MQARGGLVKHKQSAFFGHRLAATGAAFRGASPKPSQFQALRLAPRQGRHGLSQLNVIQPHIGNGLQSAQDIALLRKHLGSLRDGEVQNISDVQARRTGRRIGVAMR